MIIPSAFLHEFDEDYRKRALQPLDTYGFIVPTKNVELDFAKALPVFTRKYGPLNTAYANSNK